MREPQPIGFWLVAVTPDQELIKFGDDGDVTKPLMYRRDAVVEAKYQYAKAANKSNRYYILNVYRDGKIRTDELNEELNG